MSKTAFFIIDYSLTGGVERVNTNLSRLFFNNNIEVTYIISLRSAHKKPEMDYPAFLKSFVLFPDGKIKHLDIKLSNLLKQYNITTLIFQGDNMTITLEVQKAAKIAQCRAILHYHGSPYGYLRKYIYLKDILQKPINAFKPLLSFIVYPFKKNKLKKVILNAVDGFVCVSEGVKSEILHLFSLSPAQSKRVICIPNPLTFKLTDNLQYDKKNHVVYVSRLHRKHKNSMMVLEAWRLVEMKHPGWKLYVLGDGVLRKTMLAYCKKHHLNHVIFTGIVSNVQAYLQESSISVLTSDCEGLGMGLLESASYRNALLVTKADGGVTDIVEDGVTGYLVPRNDVSGFAIKLDMLMNDEMGRRTMGNNAYNRLAHFNDKMIVTQWKHLLSNR